MASPKYFYLCKEKGDLKHFRREFQTFFVQISVTIWHLSIRKRARKKHKHALKKWTTTTATTTTTVWFGRQTSVKSNCKKIQVYVLKLWDFARLFCAITCVTLVFHREGEFSCSFFSSNSFVVCCEINAAMSNLNGTAKTYRKRIWSIEDFAHWFSRDKFFENSRIKRTKFSSMNSIVNKYLPI